MTDHRLDESELPPAPPPPSAAAAAAAGGVYLGIDPGVKGGLALVQKGIYGTGKAECQGIPATPRDFWDYLGLLRENYGVVFCCLEKVGGFVKGNPAPGSAMFEFGKGVGLAVGLLVAAGIPYEEVEPQRWQKALGIPPRRKGRLDKVAMDTPGETPRRIGEESKTAFKNRLKARAQQLYPKLKVTHATADALLIATYAMRSREGTL